MLQTNQEQIVPAWCRKLDFQTYEYTEWKTLQSKNLLKDGMSSSALEKMFETIKSSSKDSHQSFLDCSTRSGRDFFKQNGPQTELILKAGLNASQDQKQSSQEINKNHKNILLTSRAGEGKTTLVNQLKDNTSSDPVLHTPHLELYSLEDYGLNIIDTQSLDNSKGEDNQISLNYIMEDFMMHAPSIDAIIVMWCPIKNGRSGLMKTIENLRVAYGEEVLKSCIVMIQGNWRPVAEILELTRAVDEAVEEIRIAFPKIPVIEYDAKGKDESQMSLVKEAMEKVKPYQNEDFEKQEKENFFDMMNALYWKEGKINAIYLKSQGNRECLLDSPKNVECSFFRIVWDGIRSCFCLGRKDD